MEIKKIMCCCGSGVGSSLMVKMNLEKVLKKLGKTNVEIVHSTTSDASPDSADLFVVGADLQDFLKKMPHKIVLKNLMSMSELEEKLKKAFEE